MTASYWQREAGWKDQWQAGSIPSRADFAVIGGGLAGLATAIRLRELHPGADVVVLEAERIGYGASGRNAGFLSPLAAPVWLLGADRSVDQAWGAARINAEVHATARWLAEHVPASELCSSNLRLAAMGRLSEVGLREFARAIEHVGIDHRLTEERHLVVEMDAYTVHPYRLVHGLAEHAVSLGVRIRERARVGAIETAHASALVQLTSGETVEAQRVIVCTNGYTGGLEVGELRAMVVHSFMVATSPLDIEHDADFTVEVDLAQSFHRMHGHRILFGGMDKVRTPPGGDFDVPAKVRSGLERQLRASYPRIAQLAATEAWGGRFHATTSGLPIIRASTTNPAVVLNVGYGGTGIALTLAFARLAAAVASDDAFAERDDERLLELIQGTRIRVRDAVRTLGRLAVGLVRPGQ